MKRAAAGAVLALALACHRHPDSVPVPAGHSGPAAALLGRWTYRPPSGTGIQIALTIDSASRSAFGGRITRWFAGDVGADPKAFGPVTGSIDARDSVHLAIATPRSSILLVGALHGDTLALAPTGPPLGLPGAVFLRAR
ncbi:MAG TPA: hypothetical protein VMC86_12170 [Gemmatimonadales bacterium]|nr:hypothetical protein [Gemmatimonadales bacterium]